MASKHRNKPLADILSKASKALAKSRQLRDPGKTLVSANNKNVIAPKLSSANIKTAAKPRIIVEESSSDDDDNLNLAEKSPSTFLEALDKYNSGIVTKRRVNKGIHVDANVNVRSTEISDLSVKSDLSSGTPSISLTKSDLVNSKNQNRPTANLEMIVDKIEEPVVASGKKAEVENGNTLAKTHNSFTSVKIPVSPAQSALSFIPGTGHPHETITALMKRGDKVSEETYRVLQMMVRGSEAADAAFEQKQKSEVITESVEDDIAKTDADISLAMEEDMEEDFEVPVSENITFVGETMEDIVENLMSLDLEEEEKVSSTKSDLEKHLFEFKAENVQEVTFTYPEKKETELDDDENEEESTLKEYTYVYESDFEPESSQRISNSTSKNTKSEISTKRSTANSKSVQKTPEKSVSFSNSANKTSKSSNRVSSKNLTSHSEKQVAVSPKTVVSSSGKEVLFCPLPIREPSSSLHPPPEKSGLQKFNKDLDTSVAQYSRSRSASASKRKVNAEVPLSPVHEPELDQITSNEESSNKIDNIKPVSQKLKKPTSSKTKETLKPKTRGKTSRNPVDDLMNIDGERSSRQRQKILSILRKELYEKELKRLNREKLKAERIRKKKETQELEDENYRMFLDFQEPDIPQTLPDMLDWWRTKNINQSGKSNQNLPPHLSQMMSIMDKYSTGIHSKTPSKPKGNVNFGAPYFTRTGDLAEGNFLPPEKVEIPELVQEVLDSHQRMYAMTIQTAKHMGKKYKELLKQQNKSQEKVIPETKKSSKKITRQTS